MNCLYLIDVDALLVNSLWDDLGHLPRFLGSCLEDLARSHYALLHPYELKANDVGAYSSLDGLMASPAHIDCTLLRMLNVYTSLISSTNAQCAGKIFELATQLCDRLKMLLASGILFWFDTMYSLMDL